MSIPLLATKLCVPPARARVVKRSLLVDRLNSGLSSRLTLVSAPAGYGKTTLLVDWLTQLPPEYPYTWLSLDESDNDPTIFTAYLIAAIRQIHPSFGKILTEPSYGPAQPAQDSILTALVNEMTSITKPFLLVLDDYHVIHTPKIHQQLTFILEHQPASLHLVIATREDPLLPIPRLRASNLVVEIRQENLRFTTQETSDFLRQVMGLNLTTDEIAALERHTEGWIAGLQLAALSMRGRADLASFVRAFTGSSRFILDYLSEEVLNRQSPEVQDFLLTTSILDRVSGPLSQAVSGYPEGQSLLEELEQANSFIVPLDQSRQWYRYHRLFAELLRHRLRLTRPEAIPALHQRASQWFEAQDLIPEAIQHALAAQDWEHSVKLISMAADSLLKGGELITLIGWYQQTPEEFIRAQPAFGLSYVWALLLLGRFSEAEELLADFEEIGQSVPMLLGQVAAAQAYAARARGDNPRVIEKSELALGLLPESDMVSRSVLSLNLGLVYWHEGRLREAVPALNETYELAIRSGNHYGSLTAQIFLARTLASQGALRQAEERLRKTLKVGGKHPILVLAHYDLAGIYYEWNDLVKANEHVEKGLEICTRSGNVEFQNGGHMLKACLLMAQGNMLEALSEAETTHALSQDYGPVTQARSMACHAQVALAMGDVATAKQWIEQISQDVDVNSFYRFIGLSQARLLLAQDEKAAARDMLDERLARANRAGWGYATVAIRALQAQAAETEAAALRILGEGLKISQPEGFIRTYVDAGRGLIPLLQECARRGITPDYVGHILSAYDARGKSTVPLVEPLSERELEVLRLITAGLSNREIAQKLVISTGTAKTHVHNVCGKLGVRNRTEAATRAKDLELV